MNYRALGNTGSELSVLGFGAAPLGGEYGAVDPAEATRSVHVAIDYGINFFDTSPYYGRTVSEQRLGAALAGKREKVVVCTKCGRYGFDEFDFSAARVTASLDESLQRLRTDYVDLLIAHDIEFGDREQVLSETIPAMRKLQEIGKTQFVGISGLPLKILIDVAQRGNVDFVLSYCHYNLMIRDLDRELAQLAKSKGFGLINASPLHMGMLTPAGPPSWHPAAIEVKEAAAEIVRLCQSRGADITAVALRFCLDYPNVASTLVGMNTPAQVQRNIKALEYTIDPELLRHIERVIAPVAGTTWPSGRPENSDV
ncbi:MAG: aldo/keto reductase [Acidobacteriaceae bacterium]|nr:aldo/keto reductase [Acidobacteriaceae bacterium]